ncbi:hypothetical protein KPH14_001231 [Odynerus spinipes]|uniref:Uncharacterized protein n=1 Tax=Odynerus spinipes TaxID=1348599 RepID=A0AAD9RIN2_9HYME|nr:hypothetical protein KPH14_001231 [Odynerus spinipes]
MDCAADAANAKSSKRNAATGAAAAAATPRTNQATATAATAAEGQNRPKRQQQHKGRQVLVDEEIQVGGYQRTNRGRQSRRTCAKAKNAPTTYEQSLINCLYDVLVELM